MFSAEGKLNFAPVDRAAASDIYHSDLNQYLIGGATSVQSARRGCVWWRPGDAACRLVLQHNGVCVVVVGGVVLLMLQFAIHKHYGTD